MSLLTETASALQSLDTSDSPAALFHEFLRINPDVKVGELHDAHECLCKILGNVASKEELPRTIEVPNRSTILASGMQEKLCFLTCGEERNGHKLLPMVLSVAL